MSGSKLALGGCRGGRREVHINRHLLHFKALFIVSYAALALLHPYILVYMKELGLTARETAIILTVTTAGSGLARTLIGTLTDKSNRHGLVISICSVAAGILHICLYFVPAIQPDLTNEINTNGRTVQLFCDPTNRIQLRLCVAESSPWNVTDGDCGDLQLCCALPRSTSNDDSAQNLLNATDYEEISTLTRGNPTRRCEEEFVGMMSRSPGLLDSDTKCVSISSLASLELTDVTTVPQELCRARSHNCTLHCQKNLRDEITTSQFQQPAGNQNRKKTFLLFFLVYLASISAFFPIFSIADSLVYAFLRDKGDKFGKQRLWGTISIGMFAFLSGVIMDLLTKQGLDNSYIFSFVSSSVFCFITALVSLKLPAVPVEKLDEVLRSSKSNDGMARKTCRLVSKPIIATIFMAMFLHGIVQGQHDTFFFWFLKTLGAEQTVLGACFVSSCLLEVLILFTTSLIFRFLGHRGCLYLVFVLYSGRFLVNSFIVNPWVAVATEMIQAIVTGLLFPAASMCLNALSPPDMLGTVQSIMAALQGSFGRATGAAIAGMLYEAHGPRWLFRIFSVVSLLCGILLAVALEILYRKKETKLAPPPTCELDLIAEELAVGSDSADITKERNDSQTENPSSESTNMLQK